MATIIAGLDVGNGYTKGVVSSVAGRHASPREFIDVPSAVSRVTRPNQVPLRDSEAEAAVTNDFFNNLDLSFTSPLIGDGYRRLFGKRALSADGAFEEFDVIGRRSKAEQELSRTIILGYIAAKAIKDHVTTHHRLPAKELSVDAFLAIALPIGEFAQHKDTYAARFINGGAPHLVTLHSFETPVVVRVTFVDVFVMPEGASAQFAINDYGEELMRRLLTDIRAHGNELKGVTETDVLQARNTIGIDIGEGTVNFPVFTDGKVNFDVSRTFTKGYGTVLDRARSSMQAAGVGGFVSRKQLADYLQAEPNALKRNFHKRVQGFVDEETVFFAQEVASEFGRVLRQVGAISEVTFVYGGGSGPIKETLYPMLLAKAAEMNSVDSFPVLYLDTKFSRMLNREGLYSMARILYDKQEKAVKGARSQS